MKSPRPRQFNSVIFILVAGLFLSGCWFLLDVVLDLINVSWRQALIVVVIVDVMLVVGLVLMLERES